MTTMPIRLGVIGTNIITDQFIRATQINNELRLGAVYSRNLEQARAFGAKYHITSAYDHLEAFSQSNEIDAVYIASPNAYHCAQSILMMNGKKHVLCEKPIASNQKEFQSMMAAAQSNGVILLEAMKTMYLPNFSIAKQNLHRLGKIRRITASYCQYSSRYDRYKQGEVLNAFNPALSNGALMDIGVYLVHPIIRLFGIPNKISASAIMLNSGVDGQGTIVASYDDLEAVLMYSKITPSDMPVEIQGEAGTMLINSFQTCESIRLIDRKTGAVQELAQQQAEQNMQYEIARFAALIHNQASNMEDLNYSLEAMKIMDEARKQYPLVFPADLN